MQHLRFGTIFPITWEPDVDQSRKQLQYIKGRADGGQVEVRERKLVSHMSNGNQEEFTSIRTVYCSVSSKQTIHRKSSGLVEVLASDVVEVLEDLVLDHGSSVRHVDAVLLIQTIHDLLPQTTHISMLNSAKLSI